MCVGFRGDLCSPYSSVRHVHASAAVRHIPRPFHYCTVKRRGNLKKKYQIQLSGQCVAGITEHAPQLTPVLAVAALNVMSCTRRFLKVQILYSSTEGHAASFLQKAERTAINALRSSPCYNPANVYFWPCLGTHRSNVVPPSQSPPVLQRHLLNAPSMARSDDKVSLYVDKLIARHHVLLAQVSIFCTV